jgi:hypothetical protein
VDEKEVLKIALSKQANRIADLTLNLDLAHAQIDLLTEKLNEKEQDAE